MEVKVYHPNDYAGFFRRTFANFLDVIILGVLFGFISTMGAYPAWLWELVIALAYLAGFKTAQGATLGFRIMGIKLVSIDGEPLTFSQVLVRLIASVFSALVFGLGYLWILFDRHKQAWHDKIAGTYVIRAAAVPAGEREIPQPHPTRYKLFAKLAMAALLIIGGFSAGIFYSLNRSEAYQYAQEYLKKNPTIQQKLGSDLQFGWFPAGEISDKGERGDAHFTIEIWSDRGEMIVSLVMKKRGGTWKIIKAGYLDEQGVYRDISGITS